MLSAPINQQTKLIHHQQPCGFAIDDDAASAHARWCPEVDSGGDREGTPTPRRGVRTTPCPRTLNLHAGKLSDGRPRQIDPPANLLPPRCVHRLLGPRVAGTRARAAYCKNVSPAFPPKHPKASISSSIEKKNGSCSAGERRPFLRRRRARAPLPIGSRYVLASLS